MSRIGKLPIALPDKVDVKFAEGVVQVKGPKGELAEKMPFGVDVAVDSGTVTVTRADDTRAVRANHGLARSLVDNMVTGVSTGYSRKLLIQGVGYRSEMRGRYLLLQLGYSHPILYELPEGIDAEINAKENSVTLSGASKQVVGLAAAEIRGLRPPEPYKGKGVRYADEHIRLKEGKGAAK